MLWKQKLHILEVGVFARSASAADGQRRSSNKQNLKDPACLSKTTRRCNNMNNKSNRSLKRETETCLSIMT